MSDSILSQAQFHNEEAAYAYVEARIWPKGAVCPHCGGVERNKLMGGKSTRIGLYKCYDCRKPFSVKMGTIFESSHIPLRLWLQAIFLIASSKKGVSSNQLHRTLGITLKSAWFMSHRIREAMKDGGLDIFGSSGGDVEVDETFIGRDFTKKPSRGTAHKLAVLALVERGGNVRSFHIDRADKPLVKRIVNANVARETLHYTDGAKWYRNNGMGLAGGHDWVDHSKDEYVRGNVHTNTIEGFFSVFKKGMKGVYQHCGEQHLHRYLAEFDFRYNNREALGVNDMARTNTALKGAKGKRVTYRPITTP